MRESSFQMQDPFLVEVVMKVNSEFQFPDEGLGLDISDHKKINKEKNVATVVYSVKVFEENFDSNIPFFIKISYSARFIWDDLKDEEVDDLLEVNAPAILLGYIRPIVLQLTAYAGFPPLHLPLINFQKN